MGLFIGFVNTCGGFLKLDFHTDVKYLPNFTCQLLTGHGKKEGQNCHTENLQTIVA